MIPWNSIVMQLVINVTSLTCIGVAGWLAMNDKPGWGWFLFAGVITAATMKMKD